MNKTKVLIIRLFTLLSLAMPNMLLASEVSKVDVTKTMQRATQFMTETVSYQGGYVWSYLPDFSRRWGEMEAKPTMVWVQPPGTATMGHLYLDAYHITQDESYYKAAQGVASALIKGQHPSGGWNYMFDLAGEASLKQWYNTIGKNGWRLEEFQHYYGNATFDDGGTYEASVFLLRLYLTKKSPEYRQPLYQAIQFVLDSQYPVGGWPQRFPPAKSYSVKGQADYSANITFNDDVAANNLKLLAYCLKTLDDPKLKPKLESAIFKAMDAFVKLKLPIPQPGWALQYTQDFKPASARSYEPKSVSTSTTVHNLYLLMQFYQLTADKKYLTGIMQSIDWLDSLKLAPELIKNGRTHPRMVEIGTNKTLFLHRSGSNVTNGKYYVDYQPEYQIAHYPSIGRIDTQALKQQYQSLIQNPLPKNKQTSNLLIDNLPNLPDLFVVNRYAKRQDKTIADIIAALNQQGYWPAQIDYITHPYLGSAPEKIADGDYRTSFVGDNYDTSPYPNSQPLTGITLKEYLKNMSSLLTYLEAQNAQTH
ncbi:pectate lyase [Catenovulum sp. 2E275]|uniref:pectate lyase n=1 Tax=Catenovulum sp. 2E275 TaxID=2980497 RepID=UPI0021D18635|nr:pectate lyase [Catenovulum sp. 2E275]MCU4677016.1 pectate lyase [Catenovulum sp. 2E275]